MTKHYRNFFSYFGLGVLLFGSLLFVIACQHTTERKADRLFIEDSLQYANTLLLRRAAQETHLELDSILNYSNSDDPALPVKD